MICQFTKITQGTSSVKGLIPNNCQQIVENLESLFPPLRQRQRQERRPVCLHSDGDCS